MEIRFILVFTNFMLCIVIEIPRISENSVSQFFFLTIIELFHTSLSCQPLIHACLASLLAVLIIENHQTKDEYTLPYIGQPNVRVFLLESWEQRISFSFQIKNKYNKYTVID